ncbi:MAG: DNA-processing protein DprA [Bacteroidetes bacterium]|nr:DNA-processing protein DprA [Bacteroidota bacterium]
MHHSSVYDLLLLASVPGVGHQRLRSLIDKFGSASDVLNAPLVHLQATAGVDVVTAESIANRAKRSAGRVEDQLNRMAKYDVRLVSFWDEEYPERLRQIHDAPAFLFIRGSLRPDDERSVAIVGTRRCTAYGRLMAAKLAGELAALGVTIVSGLARGIDTAAHESAVEAGGRTIAVLGSGVDCIYPSENGRLAASIINAGAVLSDYPMGTGPDAVNFPNRNRLISGISLGVVVVEAPAKSGAMITTRFALEQNREVFAVPGQVGNSQAEGPNNLIKSGAKLVESAADIVEELALLARDVRPNAQKPVWQLGLQEQAVYDCLSTSPAHVEQISATARMPVTETLTHLLALELQGAARQISGKQFIRS